MTAASASLGTLLVQRLDAVLGTTLSQQSNLVSGARPDAVSQPTQADRSKAADNKVRRHPQDNVNRSASRVAAGRAHLARGDADKPPPAAQATPSVRLRLGATARIILDLLAQYPRHMPVADETPLLMPAPGQTAADRAAPDPAGQHVNATTRVRAAATTDTPAALLRQALVQTVQNSGMFYESHLAQLVLGQRGAASLHAQPQAHAAPAGGDTQGIATETQLLVRQQLEVLANQTFAWQGQAWPGADMRWEIQRHLPSDPFNGSDASDAVEHWSSRLALQLPALGHVQARFTLTGQQVAIHMEAPDGAPQLQQHADALRKRVASAGLSLHQLSIVKGAPDAQTSGAFDVADAAASTLS